MEGLGRAYLVWRSTFASDISEGLLWWWLFSTFGISTPRTGPVVFENGAAGRSRAHVRSARSCSALLAFRRLSSTLSSVPGAGSTLTTGKCGKRSTRLLWPHVAGCRSPRVLANGSQVTRPRPLSRDLSERKQLNSKTTKNTFNQAPSIFFTKKSKPLRLCHTCLRVKISVQVVFWANCRTYASKTPINTCKVDESAPVESKLSRRRRRVWLSSGRRPDRLVARAHDPGFTVLIRLVSYTNPPKIHLAPCQCARSRPLSVDGKGTSRQT